jgi:UDPglucose--hexose-1-phosphate uridylyltransferase
MTGRWVTVATERAVRPVDFRPRQLEVESGPDRPCPFCPGNEEATPPALETYGPNGRWQVRVVDNLYPAFAGSEPMAVHNIGPVFTQASASGLHEVLVLSPEHNAGLADLDDAQAGLVMAALRDRMEEHARRPNVRYTQAIVNHGREAGASLAHPHGQLLGIPFVPGELAEEREGFVRFEGSCLLCTTVEAELSAEHRIVHDESRVVVMAPYWSGVPYEMLLIPKTHQTHLEHSAPQDVAAVGRALRTALVFLRQCIGDVAYNVVFHSSPHHQHDDHFHWHVHVLPRTASIAGFEQGAGVLINIIAPEVAAQQLTAVG